ncbi:hypothetical protein J3E72DRAFT_244525 [Bipolaris maydis]|nr:hypothetical protein BM1_00240 [Bipolaris maydis]KAJ5025352.1 hypothetical protein J3E73DRAFT_424263 [Bipolaris maydis]KAJ5063949.1 hypothetical protein J3E74DRAFT_262001 [Bipolaris maydis]KAJ6196901.1 hypothetical protein J3E72DRAFT_244525 [Bipolaris maydis]KAJ6269569.1 hypothetical protein PSV08DRAFT_363208 [Bipolaris maydis]
MSDITTQHTLAITPSSRQDIVSALLSDYGNSFEPDGRSPSVYSPASVTKELPPPPPRSDSIARKPVPASERMDAKFQLRDDQDAPLSPSSSVGGSPQPRKRIVSRSLSRGSRPPSLKLTISNGSTATVPSPSAFPLPSQSIPSAVSAVEDLPPPPPPKSDRREEMGGRVSKQARERNDSLLSQGKSSDASSPVVKRKAVPETVRTFKSLAELGNGPRGRKAVPTAPAYVPKRENVESNVSASEMDNSQPKKNLPNMQAQLPPTPDEEKEDTTSLAQPKKVFGLPSNPRVNSLGSPVSVQGKSSTGLSVLKAQRPAPSPPTVNIHATTPEPTPSPTLKPILAEPDAGISPVSPLPPPTNPRTSSVYEQSPVVTEPVAEPQQQPPVSVQQEIKPEFTNPAPPYAPTPPINAKPPARITSLEFPPQSDSRPLSAPSRPTSISVGIPDLSSSPGPSIPPSPIAKDSEPKIMTEPKEVMEPATPPPFVPLTEQSIPVPFSLVPQVTNKHLHCYTGHAQNIWSNNVFQPMACMVCRENGKERKWCCTWCQLRICKACSDDLMRLPTRNLALLMDSKSKAHNPVENDMGKQDLNNGGAVVAVYDAEKMP